MAKNEKNDFTGLDDQALAREVVALKKKLFDLKLSGSAMAVKDSSQFKKLRMAIAQALTLTNQRRYAKKYEG